MKDAFGNTLSVGDKIIYSVKTGAGTVYIIGKVDSLLPHKDKPNKLYTPPDRVSVAVEQSSPQQEFVKNPVVYASNVVLIKGLKS